MLLQQCREVTTVILSIAPWLPTYMGQSLIRYNTGSGAVVYLSYPGPTTVGLAYAEGWPPFGLALALYQVATPLAE